MEISLDVLVLGVLLLIFNVFFIIFLLLGLREEYNQKNAAYLTARHLNPLKIAIYLSFVYLSLITLLNILGNIWKLFNINLWFYGLINNIIMIPILMLYILRVWVIHYDYRSGIALYSVLIFGDRVNDDEKDEHKWFLKNRNTYGAPNYIYKFVIIISIFLNVFLLFFSILLPDSYDVAVGVIYFVLILIGITITQKIKDIDDVFFVRSELLIQFRCLSICFMLIGFLLIFRNVFGVSLTNILILIIISVTLFIMGYISTWYVITLLSSKGLTEELTEPNNGPSLNDVLSIPETLHEFIEYLSSEIMVENLFFIADVMKYKMKFVQESKLQDVFGYKVDVPITLSKLQIEMINTYTECAWAVSQIYLEGDSSYYVTALSDNIRNDTIKEVKSLKPSLELEMGDQFDYLPLQIIFDNTMRHVWKQLNQSYRRFCLTAKFDKVKLQF